MESESNTHGCLLCKKNAECLMPMQPCFVMLGHNIKRQVENKCQMFLYIRGVNKDCESTIMAYSRAKLNSAKFKRKELFPFLIREQLFQ